MDLGSPRGRDHRARRAMAALWALLVAASLAVSLMAVGRPAPVMAAVGDISTIAGGLGAGVATDVATPTQFVAVHPDGSSLYLSDPVWEVVRHVDLESAPDRMTVFAGDGSHGDEAAGVDIGDGGPATEAAFHHQGGVAVDGSGNVYVADSANYRIRMIAPDGEITTFQGDGTQPDCTDPMSETFAPFELSVSGSTLFVTEPRCHRVRSINLTTGVITPIAGTGTQGTNCEEEVPAINASLNNPTGVAVDPVSGDIFISDTGNHCIRRVTAVPIPSAEGLSLVIEPYAGTGESAELASPRGLSFDPAEDDLYVADMENNRVARVIPGDGTGGQLVQTVAGSDGDAVVAGALFRPTDVELASDRTLYIADDSFRVHAMDMSATSQSMTVVAGNGFMHSGGDGGQSADAQFDRVEEVLVAPSGEVFVAEEIQVPQWGYSESVVRRIGTDGVVTTVAGDIGGDIFEGNGLDGVQDIALHDGNLYVATRSRVVRVDVSDGTYDVVAGMLAKGSFPPSGDELATDVTLCPASIAFARDGDLYMSDAGLGGEQYWGCTNRVWRVEAGPGGALDPNTSRIHPFAGRASTEGNDNFGSSGDGGSALAAEFRSPTGLAVDSAGNVAIVDSYNCTVRLVDVQTGIISRVAGEDPGEFGCLASLSASGDVTTQQAGDGGPATDAFLFDPRDVAFDDADNLFIANGSEVRRVDLVGVIDTVAGTGESGFAGDGGPAPAALLYGPHGIEIAPDGDLYIADTANGRIRRVDHAVLATDLALSMTPSTTESVVGEPVTFTTSLLNNGPVTATNAVMTQQIPAGWQFVSASASQGTCTPAAGTVTCAFGSVPDPASATMTTVLRPTAAGASTHSASATADQPDAAPANNSASVAVDVIPIATGGVGQTPSPEPPTGPGPEPTEPPTGPSPGPTEPTGPVPTTPPAAPGSGGPQPTPIFVAGGSQPTPTPGQAVLGTSSKPDEGDRPGLRRAAPRIDPSPTPEPTPQVAPTEAPDPLPSGEPAPVDQPEGGGGPASDPIRFARSVPSLGDAPTELALLLQSLGLAIIVLLLIMFPAQIFNSTLEAHHDEVVGWFAPWAIGIRNVGRALDNFWRTPPGIAVFLLLTGVLYALLDPTIGPTFDGLLTVIGLSLGLGVVTFVAALPLLLVHRRDETRPIAAALPISLIVGVVCVLLSRLADFQPGYVYGLIIGFIFARELSIAEQGRANAIAAGVTLVAVVASFFGLGVLRQGGVEGALPTVLETALAVIAVAGLEQVMFSLVPMRFLPGAPIYAWNRLAWALLLGLSLFAFFHILINPESGYLSDTSRSGLLLTLALVGGFGVVSVSFWGYFRFRPARHGAVIQ